MSGDDGERVALASFQGAYWGAGERHATGTETGLTAIVLEGDEFSVATHESVG